MRGGLIARRCGALLLLVAGGALVYFAGYLILTEVVPQVREAGFSLTRDNMILNRHWPGNQLYVLIALYFLVAAGLGRAAVAMWQVRAVTPQV